MRLSLAFCVATFCAVFQYSQSASSQTLWTEGAESGLAYVVDGTSNEYSLTQSDFVTEGDNAFHLANPGFEDNWFVIDQDINIQADTKLFFQSRLSWSANGQTAKVQVSTNGGVTWPTDIYSQSGPGDAGEGAFNLREIDLSGYASQSARFRFYYDYTPGQSAFTQTSTNVGWRIDDIQIGSQLEKQLYSVGDPSDDSQLYLEYVNRARADAIVEANRLASETDPDITSTYNSFGVTGQNIVEQFQYYVDQGCMEQVAQPLSFNDKLQDMAQLHTQDMFDNAFQGHVSSDNPPAPYQAGYSLGQRRNAVGYSGGVGENVFSYADSPGEGHAGFDVDWGNVTNTSHSCYNPAFNGQGMQNGAGHRTNIHNGDYKEVGIGVVNGTNTVDGETVGPQLVTQNFGDPGSATYVTGVVYEDLNGNDFYDIGEGRSGVRVDIAESAYYAISSTSGAYSLPVNDDGIYAVDFTGGGFNDYSVEAIVSNGWNVKVDYLAAAQTFLAVDYNENGTVDQPDYELWKQLFGSTTDLRADGNDDKVVNLADYTVWRDALGQSSLSGALSAPVPEPASCVPWIVACLGWITAKRRTKS